jgi:hypothetical protein
MNEAGLITMEDALDAAERLLRERFGEPDQQATVLLAQALFSVQERERFALREKEGEPPYSA